MEIKFKKKKKIKTREVNLDRLIYVLSKLENNPELKFESLKQINKLMKKFHLFDEAFLNNINKI